jgi:transposase
VPQPATHRQGSRHPHQAGRPPARRSRQVGAARRAEKARQGRKKRYPRVARYFDLSYHPQTAIFAAQFNVDKYAKAEQLDGCYLLKTDRIDLSGDELWRIYILLTRAENAFRDMKSPLAERPIFHHTERRTEAHIFLCVLAYHLLIGIEKTLLDQAIHTSWPTVRDTLKSHTPRSKTMVTRRSPTIRRACG